MILSSPRALLLPFCCLALAGLGLSACGGGSATPRTGPTHPASYYLTPSHVKSIPTANVIPTTDTQPTPTPAATATAVPASDYTATISGTVTDAKSRSPIAGAIVALSQVGKQTKTNAYGAYTLKFPARAQIAVLVNARGFGGALSLGRLNPHQKVTVNFKLNRTKNGVAAPSPPTTFGIQP